LASAIVTQSKPQRVVRHKFVAADFAANTEKSLFGAVPGVPCKGYGTARFWVGGNIDQGFTLKTLQRPEQNVASGSTPYSWNQTSSVGVGASPTVMPPVVNIVGDHLDVTVTPGGTVFAELEIEVTLFP
jgi:hypothetical protein